MYNNIYDIPPKERKRLIEILTDELSDIAGEVYSIRNGGCSCNRSFKSIELRGDNVIGHFEIHDPSRNGGHDWYDDSEKFPLKYLWDDDCLANEDRKIRQENMDAIKKQIEKEKVEQEKSARAEEELYLTLKEKYE